MQKLPVLKRKAVLLPSGDLFVSQQDDIPRSGGLCSSFIKDSRSSRFLYDFFNKHSIYPVTFRLLNVRGIYARFFCDVVYVRIVSAVVFFVTLCFVHKDVCFSMLTWKQRKNVAWRTCYCLEIYFTKLNTFSLRLIGNRYLY